MKTEILFARLGEASHRAWACLGKALMRSRACLAVALRSRVLSALIAALNLFSVGQAPAQTFTSLGNHGGSFDSPIYLGNNAPYASLHGLVLSGNTFYGTVPGDMETDYSGSVYAVSTDLTGFTNVHSFGYVVAPGYGPRINADGAFPNAGLITRAAFSTCGCAKSKFLSAAAKDSADTAPAKTSIPWSQIGAKAGADYKGDGLAVIATAEGARLRCAFQKLEGEATREGLWLTSTVIPPSGTVRDRFRIVATSVGRQSAMAGDERLVPMSLRESSARSAMFIVNVPGDSQAPLGAACDDDGSARRPMPLLTELERDSVGWPFYKHGAPNGAFAEAGQCELSGLVELGKLVPGSSCYKQAAPGGAFHTARVELKSFLL